MKSFKNINILIEEKLFCFNFCFLEKSFYLKETYVFEKKKLENLILEKKLLFETKHFFGKNIKKH